MSKALRIQFGQRVRDLRKSLGESQEAFADRCGFARSYMSRIERGGANPSLDAIEVLACALQIPVGSLFAGQGRTTGKTAVSPVDSG
ncbi:helix-turn-helix domain-containing protein [Thiomonas sp.]